IRSVQNTLDELGTQYRVTNDAAVVGAAEKVILPGVGHFGQMMQAIDRLQLRDALLDRIRARVPFLGICVGLQCVFQETEESRGAQGLGIFAGTVKRFVGDARIPHMGWNSLTRLKSSKLLAGLPEDSFTYFAHSFYAPLNEATAASCTYIQSYSAV